MMLILGKSNFNFEIYPERQAQLCLPVRIFINGKVIGSVDSSTYMPSFLNAIDVLLKHKHYYRSTMDRAGFYKAFHDSKFQYADANEFVPSFEDDYDDYYIYAGRNDSELYLFWFIRENPFFSFSKVEMDGYFFESVLISEAIHAYDALKQWCNENM